MSPEENLARIGARQLTTEGVGLLHLTSAAELKGKPVPTREWLVGDLVPSGTVTLMTGDGGTGKSLLALQLACAVAVGHKWLDRTPTHGCCIFLTAEDDMDEVHRRVHDIANEEGFDLQAAHNLMLLSLAGRDALLAVQDKTVVLKETPLLQALSERIRAFKPALVVLDTLADLFGGEENQRAQARKFISILRNIAIENKCAVLLLAHPSISGLTTGSGTSGSTGWSNSVRSRLYLERIKTSGGVEEDPNARVLRAMKSNYGPIGAEIPIQWQRGSFVTAQKAGREHAAVVAEAKADRVFLKLLSRYIAMGRPVSATPSANFAPSVFSKDASAEGVSKRALHDAMNRLFDQSVIRVDEYGPPKRRRKTIVVVSHYVAETS